MRKCILAEYYYFDEYVSEIIYDEKFEFTQMDDRWKEKFKDADLDSYKPCWEITLCDAEPYFLVSNHDGEWCWEVGNKIWFDETQSMHKIQSGSSSGIEKCLDDAMAAFEQLVMGYSPETDLDDTDDDFTDI